jgi:hypothetical protein
MNRPLNIRIFCYLFCLLLLAAGWVVVQGWMG